MIWRVISDGALHFREWDDEFVVYNALSGDTHLLDRSAADLLLKLQEAPADAMTLAGSLPSRWQSATEEEPAVQIEQLLSELEALALVEAA